MSGPSNNASARPYSGSVRIPVQSVDWVLLRKQKAELVSMMMNRKTKKALREVLEGVVSFLDDVQDRATEILGKEAVVGSR